MTAVAAPPAAVRKLGYRPGLDGLRAVSVMAVLFYHADFAWFPGGFLGVEVFFVVSGFLITSLMVEERLGTGHVDLKQFWIRRARRLLPAVYLLLAVVSVAALVVYRDASGRLGGDIIAALLYVSNWWQIHLQDSYFAAAGRPPLLKHLWSLAVEEQFYLIFPPLFALAWMKFGRRKTRYGLLFLALCSAVEMAVLYTPGKDPTRVYMGTDTRAAGMLLGAVLAISWAPWRSKSTAAKSAGPAMDIAGGVGLVFILVFITQVNEFDSFIYRGGFLLLDLVCVVVIAVLVHPASRVSKVMAIAPLVWIGKRSYSLYLWHWPIFQVTRPDSDIPLRGLPLTILRMVLTFGAAELSYRYVETPLRKGALGAWWRELRQGDEQVRAEASRKGLAVGATFAVLTLVLGFGLEAAASSPDRVKLEAAALEGSGLVPGKEGDDPNAPDLEAAKPDPAVTSTTAAPTESTTTTAPTTTVPLQSGQTSTNAVAVGDSVMLGAKGAVVNAMPGIRVDAKVARQFSSVLSVAAWYVQQGFVQGPLIIHLGTNGTFTDADLDKLAALAGERRLLLVNAKVNRSWQDLNNSRMAAAAERHSNITLVDWHAAASEHPEWFVGDGTHLDPAGARAYAETIRQAL
jgi:peptidoglycan/LPS O-acetylase OafA/YrhL